MNRLYPNAPKTSHFLLAKQHGATVLIELALLAVMALIRWQWGYITFGREQISLSFVLGAAQNFVLIFAAIDFVSAVFYLVCWLRAGRPSAPDDHNSLLSSGQGGERSPIKAALAMLGCMAAVLTAALVLWS